MDAIREIVSGNALSALIKLPKSLRNRQVEIIVLPARGADSVEGKSVRKISRNELLEMKKNSASVKLTGAIPHAPITIAEIREERLAGKYGCID
jgi:hypothetical protein